MKLFWIVVFYYIFARKLILFFVRKSSDVYHIYLRFKITKMKKFLLLDITTCFPSAMFLSTSNLKGEAVRDDFQDSVTPALSPPNTPVFVKATKEQNTSELSEVVVTALGIKKQKKALGYATQEISGATLDKARETNFVSGLSGKIAGVNVMNSSAGVGSSSRITIRGDKSFNLNNNQPLFVIDGVPVSNDFIPSRQGQLQDVDYGNAASMINPDDIESVNVLKGANASALYGSRAANGVIIITTKSGKGKKGLGVSVNLGTTFETPLVLPAFQRIYGQGNKGQFAFQNGRGGGLNDGVDESWGPKMDGRLIAQFNSPTLNGYRGGDVDLVDDGIFASQADLAKRGDIIETSWLPEYNIRDFFQTGMTINVNVAVAGANEYGNMRVSYTNLHQRGVVPNTDLNRHTVAFNGTYQVHRKLKINASASYFRTLSGNRPTVSYGSENVMYLLNIWLGQQVDLNAMRNYWMPGKKNVQQFNYNYNYHDNPFFQVYENTNALRGNRIVGNINATYEFTKGLSLMLRAATDYNNENRTRKRAFSTQRFPQGSYRVQIVENIETNLDYLLHFTKKFHTFLDFSANFGGNIRQNAFNAMAVLSNQLVNPGIYSINNSAVPVVPTVENPRREVNSLYGSVQLAYHNYLFAELTARNDWSSTLTLPVNFAQEQSNNSYFYPSVSLSGILSEIFMMPSWISFLKLRASYARGGNDTDPFAFSQGFVLGDVLAGMPTYSAQSALINTQIKPEISNAFEMGFEGKLWKNRLGIDLTLYTTYTSNQIIQAPLPIASGWATKSINAGAVKNYGLEVALHTKPVASKRITWNVAMNISANRSTIISLSEEVETYQIASKEAITVEARKGNRMGDMYGKVYLRVADKSSPYYGQIINDAKGRPIYSNTLERVGNYNPDWLAGLQNTISIGNFSIGFLLDSRFGGKIYSLTQVVGREAGQLIETLQGRAEGYDVNVAGNGVVSPGVVQNADGSYAPNTVKLSAREWHGAFSGGRQIAEAALYDASFIKLREVRIGFNIPGRWLNKIGIKRANIALVARNLFILYKRVPHVDPEQVAISGGTYVPGVESVSLPTTRSFGLNINFDF